MLKFVLKAPLQSWGNQEVRDDYFTTDTKPTKSGVIGLIACALGLERGSPRISELMDELTVEVKTISSGSIMTDYHLIEISKDRPVYAANGKDNKKRVVPYITRRSYIQDGEFEIRIDGESGVLEGIKEAFEHPYWTPYLGRKACVVSEPIIAEWID